MPARTSPNSLTGFTGADKMDIAILGEKEPFFTTFMKPSEAERLVVKRALGRLFFTCRAKARNPGHRRNFSRLAIEHSTEFGLPRGKETSSWSVAAAIS